ncbi:AraC family transcriptional regulator [Nocardioides dongkuii]|uniref:AraC family transcriptional regulator n=1 Tax=Nocardioides dongkuii TaxID=2760089 RepID=UPI0018783FC9|nr:helix-turn-helix domain-containing protein [Nocardioides dongkuii]
MARPTDPTERAHLRDQDGWSPPIFRYAPAPALADVVRRYWMPVWSLPPGATTVQRVLQYPVCLIVVARDYALLVGPQRGLSVQELAGEGWALGTMFQPAAGRALAGGPVDRLTDATVPLEQAAGLDGAALAHAVRDAVGDGPLDPARRQAAVDVVEDALTALLPVDEEGLLVNAVVEHVEGDPRVQRVSQVCEKFRLSERTLQRLTRHRLGLTPKWLVQRRRLHEAAELLRSGEPRDLARVAVELGYADQAHFSRDFRTATGLTPGQFAAEPPPT